MLRILTISTLCLVFIHCSGQEKKHLKKSEKISSYFGNSKFKNSDYSIWTLSNFGSIQKFYPNNLNAKKIVNIINDLDWKVDNTVILRKDNGDWIQFGGNIQADGLYVKYQESDQLFAIEELTHSKEDITVCRLSFVAADGAFKTRYKFTEAN